MHTVVFTGPFAACSHVVDPAQYIEQCETDVCACGAKETVGHGNCECDAFASYALECARRNVILNWRAANRCCEYLPTGDPDYFDPLLLQIITNSYSACIFFVVVVVVVVFLQV